MVENRRAGSENIKKSKILRYLDNNNIAIEQSIIIIEGIRRYKMSIRQLNEIKKMNIGNKKSN